jgi:hypothetical protein
MFCVGKSKDKKLKNKNKNIIDNVIRRVKLNELYKFCSFSKQKLI